MSGREGANEKERQKGILRDGGREGGRKNGRQEGIRK
jgi:hypothetical protein